MSATHVLLIPAPGDPHGLLAEGACGSRPPTASHVPVYGSTKPCPVCGASVRYSPAPTDQSDGCHVCTANPLHAFSEDDIHEWAWRPTTSRSAECKARALVLAWDGTAVPEGCERAKAVLARVTQANEWAHRDRVPFLGDVSGGGGYTFGRFDAGTWFLRDVAGCGAKFTAPHTDRGPLDYPLALAHVLAHRSLATVHTTPSTPTPTPERGEEAK